MPDPRILLVDDDADAVQLLAATLRSEGYTTRSVTSGAAALAALQGESYDLLLSDVEMPGMDGLELLREVRSRWQHLPVVLLTVVTEVSVVVDAMRLGATNYLLKPASPSQIGAIARQALTGDRARAGAPAEPTEIVGDSAAIREVREQVRLAAACDAPVLVTGDSGTGKELVARAVHGHSRLADGPFVAQNCAAVPEELFESEFFGHARGAFTGAHRDRAGLLEQADGGVLFLDELEAAPTVHQAKLLRVFEDGELRRVGEEKVHRVTLRLVAATNVDPVELIEQGRLREDFFNRLRGFEIALPPLTERREDIPTLADHFAGELGRTLDPEASHQLRTLPWGDGIRWRGNVRLLRSIIRTASTLDDSAVLGPSTLDHALRQLRLARPIGGSVPLAAVAEPSGTGGAGRLEALKRDELVRALRDHGGKPSAAARALGIHRSTLWRWLQRYDIDPTDP